MEDNDLLLVNVACLLAFVGRIALYCCIFGRYFKRVGLFFEFFGINTRREVSFFKILYIKEVVLLRMHSLQNFE